VKVAFVTDRYGEAVVGGAEAAVRMIAERVVSVLGWQVEAFASCAVDYRSWENSYPPGRESLNGVTVRRFPVAMERPKDFALLSERLFGSPGTATRAEAGRWLDLQGPFCPDLVGALAESDADVVCFSPYLYYPVARGVPAVGRRSILQPAAHDEPPAYLPVFDEVFEAAAAFVFYGHAEQQFVHRRYRVAGRPELLLGLGVEDPDPATVASVREVRERLRIGDSPYLLCLGRLDASKGTELLGDLFSSYKGQVRTPLKLVFAGPVLTPLVPHPDVIVAGEVEEATKWGLIDGCLALVSPSSFESFGLVLLEAFVRRRPVLVNRFCAATTEQCERSGAGLSFASLAEFVAATERLRLDAELVAELGERGAAYVEASYRWPRIIAAWGEFASGVAERAAGSRN
jgi:glycosyltransferase involved in cell wall biosynthesis